MRATMVTTPFLASKWLTYATLLAWVSLSALENPKSGLRLFLTSSPSNVSTLYPLDLSSLSSDLAVVVFPDPGKPVNQITNPEELELVINQKPFEYAVRVANLIDFIILAIPVFILAVL
jgi:hypothetical protein